MGQLSNTQLVLLLVAVAARTASSVVSITSYDPLQVTPGLGGPKTLKDVGIDDDNLVRIFKKALVTFAPDPMQSNVSKLNVTTDSLFRDLRATLEVILFASQTSPAKGKKK